jgi:hypothetical protein
VDAAEGTADAVTEEAVGASLSAGPAEQDEAADETSEEPANTDSSAEAATDDAAKAEEQS